MSTQNTTITRLREINTLDIAVRWLSEQDASFSGYQAEDLVEDCRIGKVSLSSVVPEFQARGEVLWRRFDKVIVDAVSGAYTYKSSAVSSFLGSDGRIVVTTEVAKCLLDHGECSFDYVRMPIIECDGNEQLLRDSYLQGSNDGRLIKITDLRVSRDELERFSSIVLQPDKESCASSPSGIPTIEILRAPWQYPHGFSYEQFENALKERPVWLIKNKTLISKGRKGAGRSATWNPAKLAMNLHERHAFGIKNLSRVINDAFPSFLEEWNEYVNSFE